ncbi:PAS domain S-box protein [Planctomycetota bacterium]|nr:PAS domain S-box protein [Planctomycetota bacterium]
MSSFKRYSLLNAFVSSLLVMLLMLLVFSFSGLTLLGWITVAVSGGVVFLILQIVQWQIISRSEMEVAEAIAHVEMMSSGEYSGSDVRSSFGVGHLVDVVSESVSKIQQQHNQILLEKKELNIRLGIADAENKHLTSILNTLNDAVVVTDSFNEIAMANSAASKLFRFNLDESKRLPVDQIINDSSLAKLIKDTREGQHKHTRRLEQRVVKGGSESVYDVTLSSVYTTNQANSNIASQNVNSGVVTILRDVTREREIAETKSDFVSNVSHELRTPLSSIKAYMEMLIDGEAEDEKTRFEFYNIIQGETNRLSRLIDNILNISRIESGVVRVQREHTSLMSIVTEAVNIMLPQARAKQIELVEIPSPDYFQVYADRDMILQCVLNLLSNAIKYTSDGGRVSVSVSVDDSSEMVRVVVNDTGVGIPEEDVPHLFDKFYRVADHKKLAKGTGLGLNLVKHVIETVHNGEVNIESEVNHGSTFTFALPIAED